MPDTRPATVAEVISTIAKQNNVPPALALAVAQKESGLEDLNIQPDSVPTPIGDGGQAIGFYQLHAGAAKDTDTIDRTDPFQNITGGIKYLKKLSDKYKGDSHRILTAYNGGEGNVDAGTVSPEAEAYASDVLGRWSRNARPAQSATTTIPAMPTTTTPSVPVASPQPAPEPSFLDRTKAIFQASPEGQMLEGAKGAVKSGVGTVNRLLGMVSNRQIPINTEPSNTAQKLGGMVEQAGEFALPAAGVGAVAKGLPLVNALGQAATAYGVSKVQGASETGSRVNAALGALGPVVSEALPVIGQKIRDTAVTQLAQKLTKGLASPGPDVTYALKTGDVGPDVKQAVGIVRQAASDILDAPIQLGWGKWMTTLARDAAEKGKTLGQAIKGSLGQVMVPVQPILDEFDKLSGQLAEHAIPGKGGSVTTIVRNPALGDAIQDLKDIVSKYPGGQISIEHLSDLKRTWDDAVYTLATEGKVGVDAAALANTAKKKAMETGANAIRRVLEQQAPDIAALNEAASHAYRLQSLVKNLYSKQPGVGPLGQSIAHSVGGFAGYGVGELIGHPLMGMGAGTTLGGRLLVKTVESPLFQTFSAARKNMIAKAIAAGDQAGLVKALTSGVQATTSSATEATAPK